MWLQHPRSPAPTSSFASVAARRLKQNVADREHVCRLVCSTMVTSFRKFHRRFQQVVSPFYMDTTGFSTTHRRGQARGSRGRSTKSSRLQTTILIFSAAGKEPSSCPLRPCSPHRGAFALQLLGAPCGGRNMRGKGEGADNSGGSTCVGCGELVSAGGLMRERKRERAHR